MNKIFLSFILFLMGESFQLTCSAGGTNPVLNPVVLPTFSQKDVQAAFDNGSKQAYPKGFTDGQTVGRSDGVKEAYPKAFTDGHAKGVEQAYPKGFSDGNANGYLSGSVEGMLYGIVIASRIATVMDAAGEIKRGVSWQDGFVRATLTCAAGEAPVFLLDQVAKRCAAGSSSQNILSVASVGWPLVNILRLGYKNCKLVSRDAVVAQAETGVVEREAEVIECEKQDLRYQALCKAYVDQIEEHNRLLSCVQSVVPIVRRCMVNQHLAEQLNKSVSKKKKFRSFVKAAASKTMPVYDQNVSLSMNPEESERVLAEWLRSEHIPTSNWTH